MPGKLIVLDGLDGSGKTTHHELLAGKLIDAGIDTVRISFPDYKEPSSTLIKMYLNGEFGDKPGDVGAYAASSFYAVDRYASYKKYWAEDYANGSLILAARYTSSNMFHQMSKLPSIQWDGYLEWIEDFEFVKLGIPKPDRVIFLDMELEAARTLLSHRYGGDDAKRDVHERDFAYLVRCREAALYACKKMGYEIIPCSEGNRPLQIDTIQQRIWEIVLKDIRELS